MPGGHPTTWRRTDAKRPRRSYSHWLYDKDLHVNVGLTHLFQRRVVRVVVPGLGALEEILDSWERASVDEVIERIENEGGNARAKLRRLSALAAASAEPLRIDLAIRDWARREPRVAARLRRVDNRRMEYLRSLFGAFGRDAEEVEARCLVFYSLWIGNHFIAADHGTRRRADVVKVVLRWLEA